jgi:hypothetical protein
MKKELDDALCRDFPLTFRDRHASMQVTCMCWGFDVEDGWEPLIRRAAEKIEAAILKLPEADREHVCASQVKEKFGTLRLYFTSENEEISAAIKEAEEASEVTCEDCGAAGSLRKGGWLRTLCDACHAESVAAKKKSWDEYRAKAAAKKDQ